MKKLVALGSGAVSGWPSNQRNKFSIKKKTQIKELVSTLHQNKTIEPLSTYVKVNDEIDGCPISEADLIEKIEKYLKIEKKRKSSKVIKKKEKSVKKVVKKKEKIIKKKIKKVKKRVKKVVKKKQVKKRVKKVKKVVEKKINKNEVKIKNAHRKRH